MAAAALLVVMLFSAITSAQAQTVPSISPEHDTEIAQLYGASAAYLTIPSYPGGAALAGFTLTSIKPNGIGSGFGLYVAPQAFSDKRSFLLTEISFLRAFQIEYGWITMKAGGTAALSIPSGGSALLPGLHAGLGTILRAGERTGVRLDVAPHFLLGVPVYYPFVNVSIGLTTMPPRR